MIHDLNIKDADGKERHVFVTISTRQLEEIGDFNQDEEIELNFKGVIKKIDIPQVAAPVAKEGEEPAKEEVKAEDLNENPDLLKPDNKVTIELLTGEVVNKKEERKRAESLNLKPEEIRQIQQKRESRQGKAE